MKQTDPKMFETSCYNLSCFRDVNSVLKPINSEMLNSICFHIKSYTKLPNKLSYVIAFYEICQKMSQAKFTFIPIEINRVFSSILGSLYRKKAQTGSPTHQYGSFCKHT